MLSKKNRENPILMEAYYVLLGYIERDREGKIIPMESPNHSLGPTDGSGKLRLLGITHVRRKYISGRNNTQVLYEVEKAIGNIGRGIHFFAQEKLCGCLVKSYIFYPVVLAFYEDEEKNLRLSAFTARCPTSRLAAKLAIHQFEKVTDSLMARDEKEKEEKQEQKADKKEEKSKKKAVRDKRKQEARAIRQERREEERAFREKVREDERRRLAAMEEELDEFEKDVEDDDGGDGEEES